MNKLLRGRTNSWIAASTLVVLVLSFAKVHSYRPQHPEVLDARPSDYSNNVAGLPQGRLPHSINEPQALSTGSRIAEAEPVRAVAPNTLEAQKKMSAVQPSIPQEEFPATGDTAKLPSESQKQQDHGSSSPAYNTGKIRSPWKETTELSLAEDTAEEPPAHQEDMKTWDKVSDLLSSAKEGSAKVWIKFRKNMVA